jgi:uncharacterized repeat protein (TIGR02543 family)
VDVTLYALWTAIPNKTVTFDGSGATNSMSSESNNVPSALTTSTLTKPGYTFAGWSTTFGGTTVAYTDGASYPFAADATLYAVWTAIPNKTVTFDSNAGSGTMANEVDNVPTALTGNTFTRAGYSFAGWSTTPTGAVAYADAASYPFAASATLYAVWTALPYESVSFDPNGGIGTMADEVKNVPTPLTANIFTRAGYTFTGWNTAADGSGTAYTDQEIYPFGTDPTMYAQWTPLPNKTVTFDSNGGTGTMSNEADNVPTALTANGFTRPGWTFLGWNTAADGSGTSYADASTVPFASNATLFAQWTQLPVLTFDPNGGTGTVAPIAANGSVILPATTVSKPGYTFTGWNTAADGSGTAYAPGSAYPLSASGTLYAQFTKILALTGVNPQPGINLGMLLLALGFILSAVAWVTRKRRNRAASL